MRENIAALVLQEEIRGERFIYYIRWSLILFQAISLALLLLRRLYYPASLHATYFVGLAAVYNVFLYFVFRKNRYHGIIKYFSVFLDTAIVSFVLYLSSITTSTFAPLMGALTFMYLIVMIGSSLRLRRVHAIYATVLITLAFNAVYFLRYPALSRLPEYGGILASARIEQLFKTVYMLFLGAILYYIIVTLQRLIENVVQTTVEAKEREVEVQRKYEEIINGISDGIVVTNGSREILLTNPAFEMLTGYSGDELHGRDVWTLFPSSEVKKKEDVTRRFFRDEEGDQEITAFESKIERKEGNELPVEISVSAGRIGGDRVYLATVRDIRKRKDLEHQLIQSHKIETIGKLACGFAHDFSNLITVMSENIYLVQDEQDPEAIRECLCNNQNVVEKAKDLIEQILVFSTGGGVVETDTSVPVILNQLKKLLLNAVPSSIELRFKSDVPEDLVFRAHETSIVQILFNLIINARDAIEKEQGLIEVQASLDGVHGKGSTILRPREDRYRTFIHFSVSDNGMGISKDLIPRVFEPCFTTKVGKSSVGNGLGLAIIYSIVEKLGGGILVETALERGTTFSIYLPYVERLASSAPSLTHDTGTERASFDSGVQSILFVDDDEDIRHIGKKILEKQGYRVHVAGNGLDAFDFLEHNRYLDLLIVDFHMPGIEGKSFIEQLAGKSSIPILLITGEITEELEKVSGLPGIVDVVRKPLDIDRFLRTVEGLVQK
jgi:PAS domain S-box-containing protein